MLCVPISFDDCNGGNDMSVRKFRLNDAAPITPFATLIRGTPGPDDLEALADRDSVYGLGGDDRLFSAYNLTRLNGGADDDEVTTDLTHAGSAAATNRAEAIQTGEAGDDTLSGRIRLTALDPEDPFHSVTAILRQSGGDGDDTMTAEIVSAGTASGFYNAVLSGGAGDDFITAFLRGPAGSADATMLNRIDGGTGADLISADVYSSGGFFAGFAENKVSGDAGDDQVDATAVAEGVGVATALNSVFGGAGNDRIHAETNAGTNVGRTLQANSVWGGDGRDVIDVGHFFGLNSFSDIDNVVWGGAGSDTILAAIDHRPGYEQYLLDALNDLSGGSGNDSLHARIRANVYTDFTLENRLSGGGGADVLRAEIVVTFESGEDNVLSSRSELRGGSGDDALTVVGGQANLLDGGTGADRMTGGTGDETYVVDTWRDVTIEAAGASGGTDTVRAWVNHRLAAGIENLTLLGTDLRGVGNGLANVLTGNASDNRLVGLEGADRLIGGGGSDLLEGGAGADTIVVDLRPGRTGVLTLADFARTADILEFVGLEDAGAPGLVDDLDALAEFDDAGPGGLLRISIGGIELRLPGRGTGAVDSFADIVANPATQLVAADDLFA